MDFTIETLLTLPGVMVSKCSSLIGNELCLHLEFPNKTINCPHCNQETDDVNQIRLVLIRDLPACGRIIYLEVPRRQFYCAICNKYFVETLAFLENRRKHTRRFEEYIYHRACYSSFEQVGREEDITTEEVESIFKHIHEDGTKKKWQKAKRISIDEFSMCKGEGNLKTVVSDIDQRTLLEVIDSHKQEKVIEVLMEQPLEVREAIEEVSVDMLGGFPKVVKKVFPNASLVIDRFHVMQKVINFLSEVCRQCEIKTRKERYVILKNGKNLSTEERNKLNELLKKKRLRQAYEYKEDFLWFYENSESIEEGREKLKDWMRKASPIYGSVIDTIHKHFEGICNYFRSRASSGVMEGINTRIKLLKRQAYGFRLFTNMRHRLLAAFSN